MDVELLVFITMVVVYATESVHELSVAPTDDGTDRDRA
jgi:hypothetical protein